MKRIFVYGTLLRGYGNYNWCLKGRSTFIGEDVLNGFQMLNLGSFPGIIPATTDDRVLGEVFEFDSAEVLRDLDRLEGHPNFYIRTPVVLASGDAVETYVLGSSWYGRQDGSSVVESGSWRQFTGRPAPTEQEEGVTA